MNEPKRQPDTECKSSTRVRSAETSISHPTGERWLLKMRQLLREELRREDYGRDDPLPPVDLQAERELVRRCLRGDVKLEGLPSIKAFYDPLHRSCLLAVETLLSVGLPTTNARVMMAFEADGLPVDDTVSESLDWLTSLCHDHASTTDLTGRVVETYRRRKLARFLRSIERDLRHGELTTPAAMEKLGKLFRR